MEQEEPKKELNRQFFKNELKLFGKYPYSEEVKDVTLSDLMAINSAKANIIVPHIRKIPNKKIQKNSMSNNRKTNQFIDVSRKK